MARSELLATLSDDVTISLVGFLGAVIVAGFALLGVVAQARKTQGKLDKQSEEFRDAVHDGNGGDATIGHTVHEMSQTVEHLAATQHIMVNQLDEAAKKATRAADLALVAANAVDRVEVKLDEHRVALETHLDATGEIEHKLDTHIAHSEAILERFGLTPEGEEK